jgi:hypothetical protein
LKASILNDRFEDRICTSPEIIFFQQGSVVDGTIHASLRNISAKIHESQYEVVFPSLSAQFSKMLAVLEGAQLEGRIVLGQAGRNCVANPGLTPISGAVCRNLAVCPRVCPTGQAARSSCPQNG